MTTTSPEAIPSPAPRSASRSTNASPVVDADTYLEVEPRIVGPFSSLDRLTDLEGREDRTLGVVAVGDGGAEEGHHGVADVLLDMAAEARDLAPHGLEVASLDAPQILRIERLGDAR